jgi:hypothetical protein
MESRILEVVLPFSRAGSFSFGAARA